MEQTTDKSVIDLEKYTTTNITQEKIEELYSFGLEVVCAWGLLMAKKLAEVRGELAKGEPTPSTPSGAIPTLMKPETKKRKKKPGHKGVHRQSPQPDEVVELSMDRCPNCGGSVTKCRSKSTVCQRIVEALEKDIQVKTTQYGFQKYWCSYCKKIVIPTCFRTVRLEIGCLS